MARRSTASGSLRKQRRTKVARQKSSKRSVQRKRSPLADLRKQLEQRTYELAKSQAQQTATAEVLEIINSSPAKLTPVFDAILQKAHALCNVGLGSLQLYDGEYFRIVATHSFSEQFTELLREGYRADASFVARSLLKGDRFIQVSDAEKADFFLLRAAAKLEGIRTGLFVPLRKGRDLRGIIVAARREQRLFSDREISLLENFAAQAVIAIENARLFNETKEALERQTATSDVLAVISSSAGNLQRVFTAMLESAARICDASHATIFLRDGEMVTAAAQLGALKSTPVGQKTPLGRDWVTGRAILDAETIHVRDLAACDEYPRGKERAIQFGHRATLAVPLVRDGLAIGAILLRRPTAIDFTDKQIELVTNFASQAVIAVENTRLFEEVQAKTRDLQEALEHQTSTSEVLNVISRSPVNAAPVFEAIVESAARLCNGVFANVRLYDGHQFRVAATYNFTPDVLDRFLGSHPKVPDRSDLAGRCILERKVIHVPDVLADTEYGHEMAVAGCWRAVVSVPMLRDGAPIGIIAVSRAEPKPFSDREIDLLTTFADQAVIAIGNVGLFEEVRAKTRDLEEALQQQTASSEVLKVISNSPGDLKPVFEAILENAVRLCEAKFGNMLLIDGGRVRWAAGFDTPAKLLEYLQSPSFQPTPGSHLDRVMRTKRPSHSADDTAEAVVGISARLGGARSTVCVPMIRENDLIGAIFMYRTEVEPFTDKQIKLVESFAAQAVIAVQNARLFNETTEALERQTATADVLKVIASSPTNLQPVFDAIAERSNRLIGGYSTAVFRYDNNQAELVAFTPVSPEADATLKASFPRPIAEFSYLGARTDETVQFADTEAAEVPDIHKHVSRGRGFRAFLMTPLISEGTTIGAISVTRKEPGAFVEHHVQLLRTFADQAVIAIQNVKLFDEVQARTRDIQESLQQQTATADVLKVISRSTFDLPTVLQTLVESAAQLCDADKTNITRERDGAFYRAEAHGFSPEFQQYVKDLRIEAGPGSGFGRALLEGRVVHIPDVLADPEYRWIEGQKLGDYRTVL